MVYFPPCTTFLCCVSCFLFSISGSYDSHYGSDTLITMKSLCYVKYPTFCDNTFAPISSALPSRSSERGHKRQALSRLLKTVIVFLDYRGNTSTPFSPRRLAMNCADSIMSLSSIGALSSCYSGYLFSRVKCEVLHRGYLGWTSAG